MFFISISAAFKDVYHFYLGIDSSWRKWATCAPSRGSVILNLLTTREQWRKVHVQEDIGIHEGSSPETIAKLLSKPLTNSPIDINGNVTICQCIEIFNLPSILSNIWRHQMALLA